VQAIVLVGGEGTRLRPLTSTVPKPALTLVDRPLIAYMIEWLGGHGVSEAVLACGFLPDALREALGHDEWDGVRVRCVAEPEPRGTAGAIRFVADELGSDLDETFLALNGDVLTDLDLGALIREHERHGATATIGLYEVEDASAYGLVSSGERGEVSAFVEKTGERVPGRINAGMYVLERSVLDRVPAGENVSIERDVFPRLVGAGLQAVPLEGYWMDIGTPERYLQASWDILEGAVATRVNPSAPGVFVDPSAEVDAAATLGPRAVVGPGCRLEEGCEVRESVLLGRCRIGEGALVVGSILSEGVEVPAGTRVEGVVAGADERVAG
jgi:mannose-1-phosphate guanylyltransferase